jgi:hypothetical protein
LVAAIRAEPKWLRYQAYIIGDDGHFKQSVLFFCPDDGAAIERAKQLVDGHDVELFRKSRASKHTPQ